MKKRQFESLCRKLLPELPGFIGNGWLLHAVPVRHVLRGFCCDDSGFDPEQFAVWVFFLPLYVPTRHINFNMGRRLKDSEGCDIWCNLNDPHIVPRLLDALQRDGLPYLDRLEEPRNVATVIQQLGSSSDPYKLEAIAYSLAMTDDVTAARDALDRLAKMLDTGIPWQVEMLDRAALLDSTLRHDPHEAKRQLAEWERDSFRSLGLPD